MEKQSYTIRCPHCLEEKKVAKDTPLFQEISCAECGKIFEFRNALPAREKDRPDEMKYFSISSIHDTEHSNSSPPGLIITLVTSAVLTAWLCSYSNTLNGTGFLTLYFFLFLAVVFGAFLLRLLMGNGLLIKLLTVGIFEFIGLYRLYWGYTHNMHKFGILYVSMFFGGLLLFAVQSLSRGDGGSSGGSGSGCSGGCSGCGGGGGCGGCGGD
ncbi:MAG: hypothetical protein OEV64_14200 [Desulfobulbaceae bacterium]|nr:hypothetical protein [Desulfobulbaceae bacterium]